MNILIAFTIQWLSVLAFVMLTIGYLVEIYRIEKEQKSLSEKWKVLSESASETRPH